MNSEDWYCNIEGNVQGPYSARTLKTMALLGELLATDEIRDGLDGNWQLAKFVKELRFGSTVRTAVPETQEDQDEDDDAGEGSHYRYKMVQIPPDLVISEQVSKRTAAATYLESVVNEQADEGWEFYRVDSIGVRVRPGCIAGIVMAFSGQADVTETFYVLTFRRPR